MSQAIDQIKKTEIQAKDIRANALEKSREELRVAHQDIAEAQKKALSDARLKARAKLERVAHDIALQNEKHKKIAQDEKDEYMKTAIVNVDSTANTIVKRILDI